MADSWIRKDVLAALAIADDQSVEQIASAISYEGQERSLRAVQVCLGLCARDGLVVRHGDRFSLANVKSNVQTTKAAVNSQRFNVRAYGETVKPATTSLLSNFALKRDGKQVSLYTLPDERDGIAQIQMCINNSWVKIPLFGNVRICIASGIPQWCPEQETNMNVATVRLITTDGKTEDLHVGAGQYVTIAPEES